MRSMKVDVVIPTYRPDEKLDRLVDSLLSSKVPVSRILLMNTEEALFPKERYEGLPKVEVVHIQKKDFDHGGTRDQAARMCTGDYLLFMTQDAVPADENLVGSLLLAFREETVWAAYARQLPAPDCRLIEQYTRSFNYPEADSVKSAADLPALGIKTYFCSNVCAMYRRERYLALGGFEKRTIFNEDMIFAAHIIGAGGKIAYCAKAQVIHSHNYSCRAQLHRNFDLAVSQAEHPEIFAGIRSEGEGIRLVKKTAAWLIGQKKPWLIPELVMQSGFKYLGYLLGKHYRSLPKGLVTALSMNKTYWK